MNDRNNKLFVAVTAAAGLAAGWLRFGMMDSLENQGLLPQGSVHALGLWVLTLGFVVFLFLFSRKMGANGEFLEAFPPCNLRFALGLAGGAVMLAVGVKTLSFVDYAAIGSVLPRIFGGGLGFAALTPLLPGLAEGLLDCAAGGAMMAGALRRRQGRVPCPGFHVLVCLSCLYRLIRCFQSWSADPQLHDYVIQLLAMVCLMLFAYHRAGCDAGRIRRRATGMLGLMAAYFCMASLSDPQPAFYLAAGLWAMSAGPTLRHIPEQPEQ